MNSATCNSFARPMIAGMRSCLATLGLLAFVATLPAQAATLEDDEIVGIVAVANVNEINAGKLAMSNAYKDKVKAFAERMVKDHRDMDEQMGKLAVRQKLNPTPGEISETLKARGSEAMEDLKIAPKGPIFDKEYMAGQVRAHEEVLELLNNQLIPEAKNPELKNLLQKSARQVESHLDHARKLHEEIVTNI